MKSRPPGPLARNTGLPDTASGWDAAGAHSPTPARRRTLPVFETDYDRVLQWDALARTALICAMAVWLIPLLLMTVRLGIEITHGGEVFIALLGLAALIAMMLLVRVRSAGTRTLVLLAHGAQISMGGLIAQDRSLVGPGVWVGLLLLTGGVLGIAATLTLVACLKRIDRLKLPAPLQSRMGSLRNRAFVRAAVDQLRIEQDGDSADWAGSAPTAAADASGPVEESPDGAV